MVGWVKSRQRAMEVCGREFRVRCRGPCVAAARLSRRSGEVRNSRNRSSGQTCPNCGHGGCCCVSGSVLTAAVPCRAVVHSHSDSHERQHEQRKRKRTMQSWWLFGNGVEDPVPYPSPYSGSSHLLWSGWSTMSWVGHGPGFWEIATYEVQQHARLVSVQGVCLCIKCDRHRGPTLRLRGWRNGGSSAEAGTPVGGGCERRDESHGSTGCTDERWAVECSPVVGTGET